jgi:hypothetical protein
MRGIDMPAIVLDDIFQQIILAHGRVAGLLEVERPPPADENPHAVPSCAVSSGFWCSEAELPSIYRGTEETRGDGSVARHPQ